MTNYSRFRQGLAILVTLGLTIPFVLGQGCPLADLLPPPDNGSDPASDGQQPSSSADEQTAGSQAGDQGASGANLPAPPITFLSPTSSVTTNAGASIVVAFDVGTTEGYSYQFFLDDDDSVDDGVLLLHPLKRTTSRSISEFVSTGDLAPGAYRLGVSITTDSGSAGTAYVLGAVQLVGGSFVQVLFPNGGGQASIGTLVEVRVVGRAQSDPNPPIRVFYDTDNNAGNGNTTVATILANQGTAIWNTSGLAFGNYYVGAELDGVTPAVRDYSDGTTRLYPAGAGPGDGDGTGTPGGEAKQATLEPTAPQYDITILQTQVVTIKWSTNLLPGEGTVVVFREPDFNDNGLPDGQVTRVTIGNPGLDASVQELAFDTTGVRGPFYIGLTLTPNPGLGDSFTVYAPGKLTILPLAFWLGDLRTKRDQEGVLLPQTGPLQGATFRGFNFQDNLGSAMITADDYNADGLNEIVLAAEHGKPWLLTQGGKGAGEAYMIYGRSTRYRRDIEVNNVGQPSIPGVVFAGILPNPNEPNATNGRGNPLGFQVNGGAPAPSSTEGLRSLTLIPDQDGDGKQELVFGFPWCDSYSLKNQALDETLPDSEFEIGWLENNGHFLRGGTVIVSSANPMMTDPNYLSRSSDRVVQLHQVGQRFDPMGFLPPVRYVPPQVRDFCNGAVLGQDDAEETITFPCDGFTQDTQVGTGGWGSLRTIEPLRLADPVKAYQLMIPIDLEFLCLGGRQPQTSDCLSLNQVDAPPGPTSLDFVGGMSAALYRTDEDYCISNIWPPFGMITTLGTGHYGTGLSCAEFKPATPAEPYGCRILGQSTTQLFTPIPTTANRFGHSISVSGDYLLIGAPLRTVTQGDIQQLPETSRFECGTVYMLPLKRANDPVDSFFWGLPDHLHEDTPLPHNWIIRDVGSLRSDPAVCDYAIRPNGPFDRMNNPLYIVGAAPNDHLGEVTGALDINHDRVNDFAVGGPGTNAGRGAVYIIYRRQSAVEGDYFLERLQLAPSDPNRLNGLMIVGEQEENLGTAIAGGGPGSLNDDYNDDGFADLLIGSPNATPAAGYHAGQTFVLFGGRTLLNGAGGVTVAELRAAGHGMLLTGAEAGDLAGETVANAGDVNRDGIADIMIAAPNASPPPSVRAEFDADGNGTLDSIGIDLNGDGVADDLDDDGSPDDLTGAGVVYLVFGGKHLTGTISLEQIGTPDLPGLVFVGHKAGDQLGGGTTQEGHLSRGIHTAGDLDGDGRSDLLISAVQADPEGKTNAGEVYLIYGFSP